MSDQELSEAECLLTLPRGAYPFESRYAPIGDARLHYVDEGDGPAILMVHGNPTWSILYRGLIEGLRGQYRCVAVDLAGFGLSAPAAGFSFKPEDQARLVAGLVGRLDLRDATLLAHDWGGPIGRFGSERYLAFVNLLMPSAMRRRKLSAQELDLYRAPFRELQSRRPMHVFPREITASRDYLARLEGFVAGFRGPAFFVWPENDVAFRDKELTRWKGLLPQAEVRRLANCGHFLWIDAPEDCLTAVRTFMESARAGRV